MRATVDELRALARKYRTLAEVHRALAAFDDARAHTLDRTLAREFPGALRELQTVPLDELERRAVEIEAAAAQDRPAPWMTWMRAYHALLRAALAIKRAATSPLDDGRVAALAQRASDEAGLLVDGDFVRACLRPPGGRLGDVVLRRLAVEAGVTAGEIARTLFPRQRRQIE